MHFSFVLLATTAVAFSPPLRSSPFTAAPESCLMSSSSSDEQPTRSGSKSVLDPLSSAVVAAAKQTLLERLRAGEEDNSPLLKPHIDILKEAYEASSIDARTSELPRYNGDWMNINTPAFPGRLGFDPDSGLPTYAIGTLTFGLIPDAAKQVVCVVEKMVQHVHRYSKETDVFPTDIPEPLAEAVRANPEGLLTNQIDTVFRIPNAPVRGILRMEGYTIPSLGSANRFDAWFVRGRCIAQEGVDAAEWERVFGQDESQPLEYSLPKAATAFQTVVFLDDDFRIGIGNRGSVMIVGREATYSK